jgi:4-amino-4-deoxy-L-arabinose transferase-like glycosyltransferase
MKNSPAPRPASALPESLKPASRFLGLPAGVWIALAFLPALVIRLAHPLEFPAFFSDESLFNLSAKNLIVTGDPLAFQKGQVFLTPAHYYLTLALYYLFGPSLYLSRLVASLFGIGAVIFVYLLGQRLGGKQIALPAALLCAYNSLLIYSSRIATLEPEVIFYMLGAAYFWFHDNPRRVWISGLFMAAALLVKAYSLLLIPILLTGALLALSHRGDAQLPWKRRLRREHWISLGLGVIPALVGFYLLYRWDEAQFLAVWQFHTTSRIASHHLLHFMPNFWRHMPDLILPAAAGALLVLKRRPAGWIFILAWLGMGIGLISLQVYRPTRYYFQFIPLLALLAAYALQALPRGRWGRQILPTVLAIMCLFQITKLYPYYAQSRSFNGSMYRATERVDSLMQPGEAVITFMEEAILFKHLAVPVQLMSCFGRPKFTPIPLEAEFLSQVKFVMLQTDVFYYDESRPLIDFMEAERFIPTERIGDFHVFMRGSSSQTAKIVIPPQTTRPIRMKTPLN